MCVCRTAARILDCLGCAPCPCLEEAVLGASGNRLFQQLLFWHEFDDLGDLGKDSAGRYPLTTIVNTPTQMVGTGVGGGFGLTGETGQSDSISKPWNRGIFDEGRRAWTRAYWRYQPDPNVIGNGDANGSVWTVTVRDGGAGFSYFTWNHGGHNGTADTTYPAEYDDGNGQFDTDIIQWYSLEDGNQPFQKAYKNGRFEISRNLPDFGAMYDVWTHWAFTFDPVSYIASIYKNGVLIDETTNVWPVGFNDSPTFAAYAPTTHAEVSHPPRYLTHSYYGDGGEIRFLRGNNRHFTGGIAEPAMWSRILTQEEITALASGLSFEQAILWSPGG